MLAQFVELPADVQLSITVLVTVLVGLLFAYVGSKLPWSVPILAKYKEEVALDLAALVVAKLQDVLPTGYDEVSVLAVKLIIAALTLWLGYQVALAGAQRARLL